MRGKSVGWLIMLCGLWLGVGCGQPTVTPQATKGGESAEATPTPTRAITLFDPTPTATPTNTNTPTASPTPTNTPTSTPSPTPTIPTNATVEVAEATLPPGFSLIKFADLFQPSAVMVHPQTGLIYVASQDGSIHIYEDSDGDGRADSDSEFFSGLLKPVGMAVDERNGDLYVSSNKKISILRDRDGDRVAEEAVNFVRDLPDGLHQNDNLRFGPDGLLYMGIGSTCDVCEEADERSATIMRWNVDTGESEIVARGLRNPFDLIFDPQTGDLFATENGRDDLGEEAPPEELNHIVFGNDYGWPDCYGYLEGECGGTTRAIGFFEARSSTNSLAFYTGTQWPERYHGRLLAAVFGSWVTKTDEGIWAITLIPEGESYRTEMEWLLQWPDARPLGMALGLDGALYFGNYMDGGVYRLSYGSGAVP